MADLTKNRFYLASKHKETIQSAISDPMNGELVKQLNEYIDDDKYNVVVVDDKGNEAGVQQGAPQESGNAEAPSAPSMPSRPSAPSSPSGSPASVDFDDLDFDSDESASNEEETPPGMMVDGEPVSDAGEPTEDAEAAEEPSDSDINGVIDITTADSVDAIVPQDLKQKLNDNEATAGVIRVAKKNDELWVYYDDKINLNNIMIDIIEFISNLGYSGIEFNRVARSENAMVFQITSSGDTDGQE